MTRKFRRSIASFALAGLTAMAPIAPVFAQNQGTGGAATPGTQSQTVNPAQREDCVPDGGARTVRSGEPQFHRCCWA